MRLIRAFVIAFSTYSRIPMPQVEWSEENKRYSMCFFPFVGAVVGLAVAIWLWLCDTLALGGFLRGAVGAVIPLLITGGIHMDGFMDTLDAMASWHPREKRLEILKDTHTGAFAVMGCGLYLLLTAGILSELKAPEYAAVGVCFVLSRALSALTLTWLPKAKQTGMLSGFARSAQRWAVTGACCTLLLGCTFALILPYGWRGALPLAAAGLCTLYYRRFSARFFGGLTGDLAGWFVQVTELACLTLIMIGGKLG